MLDLLRRAQRELGGGRSPAPVAVPRSRHAGRHPRDRGRRARADTTLFVGFQRAEKLDGEAATYAGWSRPGSGWSRSAPGRPGPLAGVDWVRLPEDQAALQNQWLLVAETPEPIAFVGFETSEPERFGLVEVTDPSRTFAGFVTGDLELVQAVAEHLESIGREGVQGPSSLGPPGGHRTNRRGRERSKGRARVGRGASSGPGGPTRRRRGRGDRRVLCRPRPHGPWPYATSWPATRPRMCSSVCSTRCGGTGIATIPPAASRRGARHRPQAGHRPAPPQACQHGADRGATRHRRGRRPGAGRTRPGQRGAWRWSACRASSARPSPSAYFGDLTPERDRRAARGRRWGRSRRGPSGASAARPTSSARRAER